ncbi:MAG TPA: spermidine/putrescine ABC transporter substrate-binding protein [Streptosporangiaceae bacterium]|nr:spermidine/putrescine ABC transporter substrate-binding protein [Streptosporangiaceae bacterium]
MRAGRQTTALSRRGFLAGTTLAGTALAGLGAAGLGAITGCDSARLSAYLVKQGKPPAPSHPVTWPIYSDNQPIASGQLFTPEGRLNVLAWTDRVAPRCLRAFEKKYGCHVELTTFNSMPQALAALAKPTARFDVFAGVTIDQLGDLVGGKLIQPLDHSYVPNIAQVWQQFTDPFYDQNWQYTVPYTIYTTGIGWRRDLIELDPYATVNGWGILWQAKLEGKAAIINGYREAISLGLLRNDITDLATADPRLIDQARQSLLDLVTLVRPRRSNQAFLGLSSGHIAVQHAWSGQVAAAAKRLPPDVPVDALGYWFPPDGAGPVANDTMTIPASAQNPVLAHLFLNFMLDQPNALNNALGTGYMQPLTWMKPARMVKLGVLPKSLIATAVLENDFYRGLKEFQLQVGANVLWHQAWQSVVTAMKLPGQS